jgi:hypothetical protein
MLGSAQCQRCGTSLLEGLAGPVAAPPTTAPTGRPPTGTAPPSAGAPSPPSQRRAPGGYARPAGAVVVRRAAAKRSSSAGCLVPVLVLFLIGVASSAVSVVRGFVDDDGDSASSGDSGITTEGLLVPGIGIEADLGVDGVDRWRLLAPASAGTFTVEVVGIDGFDPVVEVTEVTGSGDAIPRGTNDDAAAGTTDARLDVELVAGSSYVVDVRGANGAEGRYEVTAGPRADEGDALARGAVVEGVVADDSAATHRFVGDGDEVAFAVDGVDGFDPIVRVVTLAGAQLGRDDDSGDAPLAALLAVTVPAGEEVVVEVTGLFGTGGAYVVRVT